VRVLTYAILSNLFHILAEVPDSQEKRRLWRGCRLSMSGGFQPPPTAWAWQAYRFTVTRKAAWTTDPPGI